MSKTVIVPVLISFALSLLMGPVIIPFLRKLKMGQTEREDGVKSHLKKAGTPTCLLYTSESAEDYWTSRKTYFPGDPDRIEPGTGRIKRYAG